MCRVLYLILLSSVFCFGQDDKDKHGDIALFNKGIAVYDAINEDLFLDEEIEKIDTTSVEGKRKYVDFVDMKESMLEKSLKYFKELIEKYPNSELYFMALNNQAQLELELDDPESAKESYIKLLNSKANDKDLGGIGEGLMAEPYSNYKNRACERLAEIEYNSGNYKEALKYLELTEKYPYQHYCGNAHVSYKIYMAQQLAKNYVELGDNKTALKYLLPLIPQNYFADNSELVKLTSKTLKKEFGAEKTKKLLFEARSTLHYNKNKECYSILLLNTNIEIQIPFDLIAAPSIEQYEGMVKYLDNTLLNQLINE